MFKKGVEKGPSVECDLCGGMFVSPSSRFFGTPLSLAIDFDLSPACPHLNLSHCRRPRKEHDSHRRKKCHGI
ncbi:hypothetical protein HYPSUDRAFT_905572 [Hypholoma sublateritium FD-334 SS-4]|uniref:Uncharacterized protein n=1 Tax=Hypholoma sublateritium (strain FD-334 SS-4) TaxID=945553 RepID=A0A0D2M7C5_HYPSF|nr:hypothetical protein HYPSUDRAFT_905572 [Hypholoma sublateritium FD-334 SS-4]